MCLARTDTLRLRSDKSPMRATDILTQAATSQTETSSNHTHPEEGLRPTLQRTGVTVHTMHLSSPHPSKRAESTMSMIGCTTAPTTEVIELDQAGKNICILTVFASSDYTLLSSPCIRTLNMPLCYAIFSECDDGRYVESTSDRRRRTRLA